MSIPLWMSIVTDLLHAKMIIAKGVLIILTTEITGNVRTISLLTMLEDVFLDMCMDAYNEQMALTSENSVL